MKPITEKECFQLIGRTVTALREIADNPASREDSGANRRSQGTVVDYDAADRRFLVDFGRGAIVVAMNEIETAPARPAGERG